MGKETEIAWTDATFNPWWGCTKVSPECDHCYAEMWSKRTGFHIWGQDKPRRAFGDKHWIEPVAWNNQAEAAGTRKRVFCGSMCDLMEDRSDLTAGRDRLYDLVERTPSLDWQLLTKRPQNFRRFLPASWISAPRPNVWLMTTVGVQKSLWRIDALKGCPAVVHGLSIEPLLEDLPTLGEHLDGISWVIVGGESGPKSRPMHPDWARDVRDQCLNLKVPFFFKQWGEYGSAYSRSYYTPVSHSEPKSAYSWGGGVYSPRMGKKDAGRILDGREWSEMPEVNRG